MNFLDDDELESARSHLVMLWAPLVPHDEIARRFGTTHLTLVNRYGLELCLGQTKFDVAAELRRLHARARSGDAEAAMIILFSATFDAPGVAALLALPDTRH